MISRVRENGFRRRDLSRFVASRRVRPPSPFRTPRSVPSRPLTLSLYIYFEQPRGGPVQGTRFESCRYTSCAQTLYSTFLVKAAINDAAPQCFRSLDPGSLDHGNRLDTNRSGKPQGFLFLSIEIVSNCKSRERKRSLSSQSQTFRIDIFRAREGEFFIDRVTRTSRVRHDLDTIAGHVC